MNNKNKNKNTSVSFVKAQFYSGCWCKMFGYDDKANWEH